jgi:hypothetical protein
MDIQLILLNDTAANEGDRGTMIEYFYAFDPVPHHLPGQWQSLEAFNSITLLNLYPTTPSTAYLWIREDGHKNNPAQYTIVATMRHHGWVTCEARRGDEITASASGISKRRIAILKVKRTKDGIIVGVIDIDP